ncbi:MAG: DUF4012 domain-containing protein [Candidatus Magasanikbacteria bacterium]|nr:DUF4012 domain-containing protein [Candidatus Magasanikbacteria bacterium]
MSQEKKIYTCSLCQKKGHTKKKCAYNTTRPRKKKQETIIVVQQKQSHSPHVVHLKSSESTTPEVPRILPFQEKKVSEPVRVTIDFAGIIQEENQKTKNAFTIPAEPAPPVVVAPALTPAHPSSKKRLRDVSFSFQNPFVRIQNTLKRFFTRAYVLPQNIYTTVSQGIRMITNHTHIWRRLAYASLALFVIVSVPFPTIAYYHTVQDTSQRVVEVSTHAFQSLQSSTLAALGADIPSAEGELTKALAAFSEAETLLNEEHVFLQYVAEMLPIIGGEVGARKELLKAGQRVALGNTYLVKGIREASADTVYMTDRLALLEGHVRSAVVHYKAASEGLETISSKDIPVEYQQSFDDIRVLFATFIDDMDDMVSLIDTVQLVFGSDDFRRYLVVFQNSRELRATGGFMGSFAVVDVQKGKIVNIEVPAGGTYDLQGQLDVFVKPPLALQVVNSRWEFHDANWWPDFAVSGEKIAWFYEHASGRTVDGVIAVNSAVLETFLGIVGPVANDTYGVVLEKENALDTLQHQVEVAYDKETNTPKAIIGDMVGQFMQISSELPKAQLIDIIFALHTAADKKDIQVYMRDNKTQDVFRSFGWSGEMPVSQPGQDFLFVANTNLQGQKSDAKIEQHIEHQAVVQEDGSIIDTVVIRRKHLGTPGELFFGVANISYLRVYVPEGAELLDAGGFVYPPEEVFRTPEKWYIQDTDLAKHEMNERFDGKTGTRVIESLNKTVFENWVATAPGEETSVYMVYKLPFSIETHEEIERSQVAAWSNTLIGKKQERVSRYSMVVGKQSGIESQFSSAIIYPDAWAPVWKSEEHVTLASNGAFYEAALERDTVFGVVMKHIQE